MDATRAILLTALAAIGFAAPLSAQPAGDPPLPVLPPPYGIPGRTSPPAMTGPVDIGAPKRLPVAELPLPGRAGGVRSTTYMSPTSDAQPMPAGEVESQGQTAWLAAPVGAESGAPASGRTPDWTSPGRTPTTASPGGGGALHPTLPAGPPAPAWKWHGYGTANPAPVAYTRSTNNVVNYSPSPAPYVPPQPHVTPLPMPTPQPPDVTPLPMPTPQPPSQISAPGAGAPVPGWPNAAPPMQALPMQAPPMLPPPAMMPPPIPSEPPPVPSVAIEPTWRAAGTHLAVVPPPTNNPVVSEDLWMAAGARNRTVARAQSPDLGPPQPAPVQRPASPYHATTGVQQASYNSPPPARPATARPAAQPQVASRQPAAAPTAQQRPAAAPPKAPAISAGTASSHLRTNIERACTGKGRNLEVYSRGPASLLIRVTVSKSADAEALANLISQIPELAPYEIVYEMRVAQ